MRDCWPTGNWMNLSGRWIDNVHRRRPLKELILDLDSSVSETYGRQQGTAYKLTLQDPESEQYRRFLDGLLNVYRTAQRIQRDKRFSDAGRQRSTNWTTCCVTCAVIVLWTRPNHRPISKVTTETSFMRWSV